MTGDPPAVAWLAAVSIVAVLAVCGTLAFRGLRQLPPMPIVGTGDRARGESSRRSARAGRIGGHPIARRLAACAAISVSGAIGWVLAGPMGLVIGVPVAAAVPIVRKRRRSRSRAEAMERDLAELAATTSLALRSGLSAAQAFEYAGSELASPTRALFDRFLEERRLGVPFDAALERFGASLATEDAQLFVLVMNVHSRSGGDLAGALDEVVTTIRHRLAVRRELRAASTQGRVSGAILGALPVAFFCVLATTSHRQLAPVYRSVPGIGMIAGGLAMEAFAYLWIRRLLRIDI